MCYPRIRLKTNSRNNMTSCALEVATPFKTRVVKALQRQNPRMTKAHAVRAHAFLMLGSAIVLAILLIVGSVWWWGQRSHTIINQAAVRASLLLRSDSSSWDADINSETNRTS